MKANPALKLQLHQELVRRLDSQIETISKAIHSVHDSKANETKSSVGDKYETGRAMLHQEEEQLEAQLSNTLQLKQKLEQLKSVDAIDSIGLGSLIKTNKGTYFLAIGIGKVTFNDTTYFVISPDSPIGKLLVGKKEGDKISFNGNLIEIAHFY